MDEIGDVAIKTRLDPWIRLLLVELPHTRGVVTPKLWGSED